jgi:hypothetical protein
VAGPTRHEYSIGFSAAFADFIQEKQSTGPNLDRAAECAMVSATGHMLKDNEPRVPSEGTRKSRALDAVGMKT